ncbi:MAG: hypothetical protein GX066_09210 [Clostridiaceae bacterium]|nr:hypothetical protein [Clostridiaceae bacterium]
MTKKNIKKRLFFSLVFFVLTMFFFIFLELFLRLIGYGFDTRIFVKPKYIDEIYIENISFINKYNPKENWISGDLSQMLIRNVFEAEKSENTLRGFVIGGSSAQGFPYESNQSFSKITELALKQSGKYENVEILNLGATAMSSYYIKDVAKKVLKYRPDFIVIYGGHNEYYGTISYTTGGNYYTKNLYLLLKESRIFQLIFSLIDSNNTNASNDRGTLMTEQFNNKKVFKDGAVDKKVAQDFIRNIDEVVSMYSAKDIPVIIVEPVSNLYDMPPFSGENDEQFEEFIKRYHDVILENDREKLQEIYNERLTDSRYNTNANIKYLDALCKTLLDGKPSLDSFIEAKDFDGIPFRARSELVNALKDYCMEKSRECSNLFFIPFSDYLISNYGEDIFGNDIFIDHLHFNQRGQRILSKAIAEKLAEIFHFDETQIKRINDFYSNDKKIDSAIYYLPAYKVAVDWSLKNLLENPPYSNMLIKYKIDEENIYTPENEIDKEMQKLMQDTIENYNKKEVNTLWIANHYIKNNDPVTAKDYINSGIFVFPGSFLSYYAAARYYRMVDNDFDRAKGAYINAYLLSEKLSPIYDEMKEYFISENQSQMIDELDQKYGPPKKWSQEVK